MENQNPQEHHEEHEEVSHGTDGFKVFLSILAVILVISNIITVYFLLNKNNKTLRQETPVVTEPIINEIIDPIVDEEAEEEDNIIELETGEILIDWYKTAIEMTAVDLFGPNAKDIDPSVIKVEKIGNIIEGPYIDNDLYRVLVGGMTTANYFATLDDDQAILFITSLSSICESTISPVDCIINKNITIKNIETPKLIEIPDSDLTLVKKDYQSYQKIKDIEDYKQLFEYNTEKYVYQETKVNSKATYYFTEAEDHTIRVYEMEIPFAADEWEAAKYFGKTPNIFEITWSDSSQNEEAFLQEHVGSMHRGGAMTRAFYVNGAEDLKITGQTSTNDPIYELKDVNTKEYKQDTQNIFEKMYERIYSPEGEKISYEEFLTKHSTIFWQDPFGNFLEFKNALYMPAAEMGKPVIYLYPEKTTDVLVRVAPNKGLTITEPAYNDGWFVQASPNGNLYNYNDKQTYPYLFWEGLGINYRMPEDGFVVAKADVEKFLIEKLTAQGLIANEYNEFIEFWTPKMNKNPYYFITFIPQLEFNRLAPLEVNPQPDTIIRVFMDYKGLDKQIEVNPQIFKTPQRNGFTVVEWGGALHN